MKLLNKVESYVALSPRALIIHLAPMYCNLIGSNHKYTKKTVSRNCQSVSIKQTAFCPGKSGSVEEGDLCADCRHHVFPSAPRNITNDSPLSP